MKIDFYKPIKGNYLDITRATDEVFSTLMLGPGFVVIPKDIHVYAPFHGKIKMIYPTLHAIAISTNDFDVLIHIGLTDRLRNPDLFDVHVKVNDDVEIGDLLITFKFDLLNYRQVDLETPIVFVQKSELTITRETKQMISLTIK